MDDRTKPGKPPPIRTNDYVFAGLWRALVVLAGNL